MTSAVTPPVSAIQQGCRSALSDRCRKDQCSVVLNRELPTPWTLVDMDAPSLGFQNTAHCDYLFVAGSNDHCLVVPIELTSGRNKTLLKAIEQLQTGADLADRHLHSSTKAVLRPVFATKTFKAAEKIKTRKLVKFRGQSEAPEVISCGDPLSKALT